MSKTSNIEYDVIVIGAGHAGCEAALASARMGARTVLLTMDKNAVARMSCNPSIGGMAKSHIVFELDALGGEMAENTDYTGIQFRVLNTRKGPSVRANRAQCDKAAYSARMIEVILSTVNLSLHEGIATELCINNGLVCGVFTENGSKISGKSVILAAGTFLNGKMFVGKNVFEGGRIGEGTSKGLTQSLISRGFIVARLKTGTPPRLHKDSIDYSKMEPQPGILPPPFFSIRAHKDWMLFHVEHSDHERLNRSTLFHVEQTIDPLRPWPPGLNQMPCYLTHTTPKTHDIIRNNLSESALYGGLIEGVGVRYCPSIEDKVVKFTKNDSHHVFVEPEGRVVPEIYPNGTSNSLPESVQIEMIHSIPGLENARFILPGYAIEYDFFDPTQLYRTLETKLVENLFFAGQINGTTGYEEAAGQGFIAGVNAVLKVRGEKPFTLSRNESYIGVLIDDLTTKGTNEPYRMFTSRAEHRLLLRQDNARFRMLEHAKRLGIVERSCIAESEFLQMSVSEEISRLKAKFANGASLFQQLSRPGVVYADIQDHNIYLQEEVIQQIEFDAKYSGYIDRELRLIERTEKNACKKIPPDLQYGTIHALRIESIEKLQKIRPENLDQASRISGITPADISILAIWIDREKRTDSAT